ncbi:hypothetical protein TWF696_002262 [Orbilia brochopaga]|uniref:Uncharacterized protein n=1 Tax=Orbilia brochopaga TaxID=3140254 RepID=A0AAV9U7N8_9PEZI
MTTISHNTAWSDVPAPALTTIFTPPCNCINKPVRLTDTTVWPTPLEYDWGDSCSTWQLCDPVEYITWACSLGAGWISSFSPGVCPQDWTAVGTLTSMDGKDVVTTAWCCPHGFYPDPDEIDDCLSSVTTPTYALQWTSSRIPCGDIIVKPAGTTSISSFTIKTGYYTVAWRSADLPNFTPASAPLAMFYADERVVRSECEAQTYTFPSSHLSTYTLPLGSCSPTEAPSSTSTGRASVATFGATAAVTFAGAPAATGGGGVLRLGLLRPRVSRVLLLLLLGGRGGYVRSLR